MYIDFFMIVVYNKNVFMSSGFPLFLFLFYKIGQFAQRSDASDAIFSRNYFPGKTDIVKSFKFSPCWNGVRFLSFFLQMRGFFSGFCPVEDWCGKRGNLCEYQRFNRVRKRESDGCSQWVQNRVGRFEFLFRFLKEE